MRRPHTTLMNEIHDDPKLVADQLEHTVDVNQNVYTRASVARRKSYLHLSMSDGRGRTVGGHLVKVCRIYTTAEVARRAAAGGYAELKIDLLKWDFTLPMMLRVLRL